jgi:hypothetical protein
MQDFVGAQSCCALEIHRGARFRAQQACAPTTCYGTAVISVRDSLRAASVGAALRREKIRVNFRSVFSLDKPACLLQLAHKAISPGQL